jgi:hypothetical protein
MRLSKRGQSLVNQRVVPAVFVTADLAQHGRSGTALAAGQGPQGLTRFGMIQVQPHGIRQPGRQGSDRADV